MSGAIGITDIATTFGIGVLTFISPCVLPIIPSYLAYISGTSFDDLTDETKTAQIRLKTFLHSLMFVLGFSLIFIILGATATFIGSFLNEHLSIIVKVAGALVIFFGLHLAGWVRIPFLMQEHRMDVKEKPAGLAGSFLVGLAFGAGWTPCVGPMLGTALGLASTKDTVTAGIVLLGAYALGMGIPFLIASLAFNHFLAYSQKIKRHMETITKGAGIFLILVGILMVTGLFAPITMWFQGLFVR